METLVLARHGHSASNSEGVVSGVAPGDGLSPLGVRQATALRDALAEQPLDVGLATELRRTQETLRLALAGRTVPTGICTGLNEIGFGAFEGGPLERYRAWAWGNDADAPCPGGGESRAAVAARLAVCLDDLLARPERTILAISHALPLRYALDAADGHAPRARVEPVPHARAFPLSPERVARAAATLRRWAGAPAFRDRPVPR